MGPAQWVVLLVALQRLAELAYSRRNSRRLLSAGAIEVGAGHYPLVVLLHGAWLAAIGISVPPDAVPSWPLLAVYGLLQAGRLWVLATLRGFWTTRILTLPQAPLATGGPYRFCRHPNYVVVAAEIAVLPLAFGAWTIAALFSALNAVLLAWRIRVEDRALESRRALSPPPSR
jgi:methyltransferase